MNWKTKSTDSNQCFFFHICDVKILPNFAPKNCKIGRNYTRKTYFSKIPQIFLSKKKKKIR